MSEVIDFANKTKEVSTQHNNPVSVGLLKELNLNPDIFQDLMVFFRKEDGTVGLIDTRPSIEDKCLFLQMLQHQITSYMDLSRHPMDLDEITSDTEEDI